jgi:hypothetical protein
MSLLLALFEEHKQRTGHDFTKRDDERVWCCTVCNALYAEKIREDVDEARDAESDTANSQLSVTVADSNKQGAE